MKLGVARLAAICGIVAVGTAAVACGGGGSTNPPQATTGGASSSNQVQLDASDYQFSPAQLQVAAGATLTVKLTNTGKATHSFTIRELNVDAVVQPGQETDIQVTPQSAGTLQFICRFHQSRGMVGTLTVTAGGGSAGSSAPAGPTAVATAPAAAGYGSGGY